MPKPSADARQKKNRKKVYRPNCQKNQKTSQDIIFLTVENAPYSNIHEYVHNGDDP